jgi:hypothetical protein|tara:strand:- start:59 stop:313 length:255 start_codon:yes stop_codon:yes gene_type:complete
MTVRELLARIDSKELSEWMAYYELNPFGTVRDDLQAGIIASTIANVNRGKSDKSFTPSDFMPYMDKPEQSEGDMQSVMDALAGK